MIRLTIGGPRIVEDDGWAALRQEFARRHCVVLEGFVDKGILERVPRMLEAGRFHTYEHVNTTGKGEILARELRMGDTERLPQMFLFLLNQPRLFDAIAGFTGCDVAIRCFSGRCYKRLSDSDHFTTWHNDAGHPTRRLFGLTINLSPEPCGGGGFQIRCRKTREVLRTVRGTRLGDACLFRIDRSLQHRALVPEEGSAPRCVYTGWFLGAGPDWEYVRGMRHKAIVHETTAYEPSDSSAR